MHRGKLQAASKTGVCLFLYRKSKPASKALGNWSGFVSDGYPHPVLLKGMCHKPWVCSEMIGAGYAVEISWSRWAVNRVWSHDLSITSHHH